MDRLLIRRFDFFVIFIRLQPNCWNIFRKVVRQNLSNLEAILRVNIFDRNYLEAEKVLEVLSRVVRSVPDLFFGCSLEVISDTVAPLSVTLRSFRSSES